MKFLVIIPARSGSKGLKGKNWRKLKGKPLIEYTIDEAIKIFSPNEICISTDSDEILKIAKKYNLTPPFIRPSHLSSDFASTKDVIIHALEYWTKHFYKPDYIVLLQPTSPLRNYKHIKGCLDLIDEDFDMIVSVKETSSNPYYVLFEENNLGYLEKIKKANFTRRQDCPKVYELNGAVYIINPNSLINYDISNFKNVKKYLMSKISSIDIDDDIDWIVIDQILNKGYEVK